MTSGVGSIEELSNVVSGSPFQINGDANTYAWTGTAGASTSTLTTPEGVVRTNLCTNGSVEAGLTGWSNNDATVTQSTDWSDDGTYSIKVVATGASTQSFATISIPLVSGHTYTVSATIRLEGTLGGSTSSTPRTIRVFDATFAHVNDSSAAPNEESETRLSNTFTAAATNTHLVRLYNGHDAAGATVYWDSVLIEEAASDLGYFDGDSAGYDGAGITAATNGTIVRTNLVTNPSFETNTTSWSNNSTTGVTISRVTSDHISGAACLQIAQSGTGNLGVAAINVSGLTVGQTYNLAGYVKVASPITATCAIQSVTSATVTPAGAWTRVFCSFTATATSRTAVFTFTRSSAGAFNAFLDAVTLESAGTFAGDFFDGNSTDTDTRNYAWTGTANNSTSTATAGFVELVSIDTASELDQIVLTRDSNPGTVAVEDPDGRIVVFDPDAHRTLPGPGGQAGGSLRVFTDDDYSAIDMAFDMSHIINVLDLTYFTKTKVGNKATKKVAHTVTFQDLTSIGKYGRFKPKKPPTIHKKADFADYALKVFARNADPEEVPRSITIPIIKAADLLPGYEDGHFVGHKVVVWLPDGVTSYTCRVARIQHSITPGRWSVQVFLRDQNVHHHFRTSTLSSEVANNPDKTVLANHLEDDLDATGKTITSGTFDTTSGLGVTGVTGMRFEDDASGGVLKFWTGATSPAETGPGWINPVDLGSPYGPSVEIASPLTAANPRAKLSLIPGAIFFENVPVSIDDDLSVQGNITGDAIHGNTVWVDSVPTTGSAANTVMGASGQLQKSTSVSRRKVDQQPIPLSDALSLLDLTPITFLDRGEVEANGSTAGLLRIPGVTAEDVEEHAPTFAVYEDGVLSGVAYDRMGVALIPIVRDQAEQIAMQAEQIAVLTRRLDALGG